MRQAQIQRTTNETNVDISINLDGEGVSNINTGIGFFNHMLTLFASHGRFDLDVECDGDVEVDGHHSIEDIGIALGTAFKKALGDKRGINRYGTFYLPMDETLALVSVDISGRPYLVYYADEIAPMIGNYQKAV